MDGFTRVGVFLLGLAVVSTAAASIAAFLSRLPEVGLREAWQAGSNLWLEPKRYLRPERVRLVKALNVSAAALGILGVLAMVATAVRGW